MAPCLLAITPATPELPLAPTAFAPGQRTDLPAPSFHSGEKAANDWVKALVVPEPSERCTQVMAPAEQPRSFQLVILPIATWTACFWVSLRSQPGLL